jgi:hypothetical protein
MGHPLSHLCGVIDCFGGSPSVWRVEPKKNAGGGDPRCKIRQISINPKDTQTTHPSRPPIMDSFQISLMVLMVLCLLLLIGIVVLVCTVTSHFMKVIKTPEYITKFIVSLLGKGNSTP